MDLYVFKEGQNIGPLTPAEARQGIVEGRFRLDDHAITRSLNSWATLEEVLKLLETSMPSAPTKPTWQDFIGSPRAIDSVDLTSPPTQSTPSNSPTSPSVKPWGCLYAFGVFVVLGTLAPVIEGATRQLPALGMFHIPFLLLTFVSFCALVAGLIDPALIEKLTNRTPSIKTRFFPMVVTRKHVAYIFGTALPLFIFLSVGTDAEQIQQRDQYLLAQQNEAAAKVRQAQEEATHKKKEAEQQRLAAIAQAKKERLAQEREDQLRQQRLEAEARSAEVQARIDERAEAARVRVAEREAQERAIAEAFEPKVQYNDSNVTVTNDSATDWERCRVRINGGLIDFGYQYRIPSIKAGQTIEIPLSDFAKNEGDRFSIFTMKVRKIAVDGYVNDEFKHYEGSAAS